MAIRVGVAGLRRGQGPLAVLAAHPLAEVIAIADLDLDLARRTASRLGRLAACSRFEELLELDLEAVFIATPPALHAVQSIAALERGRHVLCEVPAVWSIDEARRLVAAARRSPASYMLAENVNFLERTVAWGRHLASGALGDVVYAEAEYVHDCRSLFRDADGRPTWRAAMPPIQYCTHSLGPLLAWTGDRCIEATGLHTGGRIDPGSGAIDFEVALFRTASGAVFKVLCAFSVACEPGRHWYCVYGTRGMLESGRAADLSDRGYLAGRPETRGPAPGLVPGSGRVLPPGAVSGGHGEGEWFMIDAWLRAIVAGSPMPIDLHAGLDMTLPGIVAHESALGGGRPGPVPDSREW